MFLNYLSLGVVLMSVVVLFYGFIYIHELPYEAAKHRNHPQQDAIYVACWLSLFTLHAIWPLVFIWALSHKEKNPQNAAESGLPPVSELSTRLAELEAKVLQMEQNPSVEAIAGGQR